MESNPLRRIHPHQEYPNAKDQSDTQAEANFSISDWREGANCLGKGDKMFPRFHKDISYITEARKICRACPVREPCLDDALEYPTTDMHGVWGGLTPRQLAAEQQRRGIEPSRPTLAQIWAEFARQDKEL